MAENTPQQEIQQKGLSPMVLGVLLGIVFLIVGFGAGYFLSQGGQEQTELEELLPLTKVNTFQMKTAGEITDIQDGSISIERGGEQTTLTVPESAKIRKLVYPTPEEVADPGVDSRVRSEDISLSALQAGDPVVATSSISPDGSLVLADVVVLGSVDALPPL